MSYIEILSNKQRSNLKTVMKWVEEVPKGTEVFEKDGGLRDDIGRCSEWIKTPGTDGKAYRNWIGFHIKNDVYDRHIGARPAFTFSSINEICTNGASVKKSVHGQWRIEGRYVPQETIPGRQKALKQMLKNGKLKLLKKGEHPKFRKAIDKAFETGKFDPTEVEYLDEYIDIKGNRYAVRQDGENIEFELCKPMVAYAEKIEDNKYMAMYEKAYFGGIPFNLENNFYSEEDFPKMLISQIMNGPLKKFLDLTMPERETQIEITETEKQGMTSTTVIAANAENKDVPPSDTSTSKTEKIATQEVALSDTSEENKEDEIQQFANYCKQLIKKSETLGKELQILEEEYRIADAEMKKQGARRDSVAKEYNSKADTKRRIDRNIKKVKELMSEVGFKKGENGGGTVR